MSAFPEAAIEADPKLPIIRITRDFTATPQQLLRAHTDPDLFARWCGPDAGEVRIVHWDARTGGSWQYVHAAGDDEYGFRGTFHEVRPDRIVQTFTFEGMPDGVALETLTFEDLGDGRTRLTGLSLCDSFADREAMLASGMETGIREGYERLDDLLV